jgi:NAD(P)-dependent dehydrogenase (short-subunit alcohol dehydrogenase family)
MQNKVVLVSGGVRGIGAATAAAFATAGRRDAH